MLKMPKIKKLLFKDPRRIAIFFSLLRCYIFVTSQIWEMATAQLQTETVTIKQGVLRGYSKLLNGQTVYTFLGIPYAEPPVGNRRLRPTSPHPGWQDPYLAQAFKPVCPQPSGNSKVKNSMSEDCLYLNVWSTHLPTNNFAAGRKRPVVIFIEGQLFTLSHSNDIPPEDFVSEQDLVFVSLNYRLNAFGFLSWEDDILPGNLGLLDQYLAILWVYENIESFGGDRNELILMGHSAGAASILYHLISPRTNPYIKKVIMMSGSGLAPWASQPRPRDNARSLARSLGCMADDSKSLLNCLQGKTMLEIVTGVDQMIRGGNVSALFAPVSNESFLAEQSRFFDEDPETALKRGNFKKVPMMCGLVSDEGMLLGYFLKEHLDRLSVPDIGYFMENTVLEGIIRQLPGLQRNSFVKNILMHEYFESTEGEPEPSIFPPVPFEDRSIVYDEVIQFFTDSYFLAPVEKLMRLVAAAGGTVYFYTNDFRSRDIFGNRLVNRTSAAHGSDLLYLFGPEMYRKFFDQGFQTFSDERMSKNLKVIMGDFVAMGAPTTNLNWRPYTADNEVYYEMENGVTARNYKGGKAFNFWNIYLAKLAEQYQGVPSPFPPLPSSPSECTVYIAFTYVFLAALLILLLVLIFLLFMMKRTASKATDPPQSVFSVSGRSLGADSSFHAQAFYPPDAPPPLSPAPREFPEARRSAKRHWRESVTDYRL